MDDKDIYKNVMRRMKEDSYIYNRTDSTENLEKRNYQDMRLVEEMCDQLSEMVNKQINIAVNNQIDAEQNNLLTLFVMCQNLLTQVTIRQQNVIIRQNEMTIRSIKGDGAES